MVQRFCSASDAMIREALVRGRTGTPMASFLERGLSEKDINDLVAFVRSFEDRPLSQVEVEGVSPVLVYESPYDLAETVDILPTLLSALRLAPAEVAQGDVQGGAQARSQGCGE